MCKWTVVILTILMCSVRLICSYPVCVSQVCKNLSHTMYSYMNTRVDACDDYFNYTCGNFSTSAYRPPYIQETMDWKDEHFKERLWTVVTKGNLTKYKSRAMSRFFNKIKECRPCGPKRLNEILRNHRKESYRIAQDYLISSQMVDLAHKMSRSILRVISNLVTYRSEPQLDQIVNQEAEKFTVDYNLSIIFSDDRLFDLINNFSMKDPEELVHTPPMPPQKMYGLMDKYGFFVHSRDVCE